MNFYKRFIGDIQAKTGGLTLAEFGAYDRLLDHYYSTELPVPQDEVYRICRAMSASERAAVDKVLSKFFELTPGGYAQAKADDLIAKAQPLIAAARENGKKGGRPKKEPNQKPSGFPKDNQTETQLVKALQSQNQISPEGDKKKARVRASMSCPVDVDPVVWDDFLTTRKSELTDTALQGIRREADKAGWSLQDALRMACERGWRGFRAKWVAETVEPEWRRENRERVAQFGPGVANKPTGYEVLSVPAIASH